MNTILILSDTLSASIAILLATFIRQLLIPLMGGVVSWSLILNVMLFYIPFTIILAWLTGLYPGSGLAAVQEMQKVLYVVSLSSIFLGVLLFLQQVSGDYSRLIFVMTWFLSAGLMISARFIIRNIFSRRSWWGIPLIVVGSPENAKAVVNRLKSNRRLGLRPVCTYDPNGSPSESNPGMLAIHHKDDLIQFARDKNIKHIVFTDSVDSELTAEIYWMREIFPHMLFILNSTPFSTLWSHTIDVHGTLIIGTDYRLLNKSERIAKALVDKLLTIVLLLFSWPIFLILALLVKLDSKGPILYSQKRLGLGGTTFNSYKFRTMYQNAEEKLVELLANDPEAAKEYAVYHKLANDPRVTRVGRFLRRYSLDEFPQLINALKGDMNLIGPRSYLPRELPDMGQHAQLILKVKPGLTGWWQVMGRNATSFEERMMLDEYYISNWSIWLDIFIVIKTVWVLISGQGR
jgi:Undecaprenyl-phosphate galactose phosphotransferase WbaP